MFMNVTLFMQIIQDFWAGCLSEETITCLIRAGMVLATTKIWKVFVQKRDFTRITKKSMILKKSETKNKIHRDDFQSEVTQSVMLKKQIISAKLPQENAGNNSDVNHDSGNTFNSQETISDNEIHSNSLCDHTSEKEAVEETVQLSANFLVEKDFGNTKSCSESGNSKVNSSDSDSDFFSSPALCNVKKDILSESRSKINL